MRHTFYIVTFMLSTLSIYSQTNFEHGFKHGYKVGYCYGDFGCLSPYPPIAPRPNIGERSDNYDDGYNRGFALGIDDKKAKLSQSNNRYENTTPGKKNSDNGIEKRNIESGQSTDYELRENRFDIYDVILNSTTLSQLMGKINFSFEQSGEKVTSNDRRYVTVRYQNNSLVHPLVTYTINGDIDQIMFLMPLSNSRVIGTELIKRYGTKFINGEEVISRGNLTYDIRREGDIGAIIIY